MNVLAGCITAAAAAIADARIDCLDLVVGGVAALVAEDEESESVDQPTKLLLDPDPSEHRSITAACVVAYLPNRDEITQLWMKGDTSHVALAEGNKRSGHDVLLDGSVDAARGVQGVLAEAARESGERFVRQSIASSQNFKGFQLDADVEMKI
jgi:exosome complex component MTR3